MAGSAIRRTRKRPHEFSYVLGEGASVGRSRLWLDAASVAPIVLLNTLLVIALYFAPLLRVPHIRWDAFFIVVSSLALLPVAIASVLVSLRDHEQPITVATFVTGVALAVVVAILSASRIFMSYWGVLFCAVPTVFLMIAVMLRLQQKETERVALLDFSDAETTVAKLGGNVDVIDGEATDLEPYDRLLIDMSTHHSNLWSSFLLRAHMRGVLVTPWVQFLETRRGRVDIDTFDFADIVLRPGQILYSRAKRAMDIVFVILAAPLALVLYGLTYLYILVRAGRPVHFIQQRRGYGGHDFTMYKFRTMQPHRSRQSARDDDDRIIPGLKVIRGLRLDEIPQLYNIWRGEMSWVGPRPAVAEVAKAAEREEPKYANRLLVRPGLSGWAQVNAGYASTTAEEIEKLEYDLYYVKNMSFDLDLLIMFKTIRILLLRIGAK
jgi:lipopolysaccharide/colanic/teichoic acid biosynthesis glycosyltransferase